MASYSKCLVPLVECFSSSVAVTPLNEWEQSVSTIIVKFNITCGQKLFLIAVAAAAAVFCNQILLYVSYSNLKVIDQHLHKLGFNSALGLRISTFFHDDSKPCCIPTNTWSTLQGRF